MQKLKHHKRRNTGLLYEFFTRYVGKAILENRDSDIVKAKTLLRKHFNRGTDIYKELKLVKALTESKVTTREQAVYAINRVREIVKVQSQARLDLEKTSLIQEINSSLKGADKFFDEMIPNYKQLATVQVLLNTWRDETLKESVVSETLFLEERLIDSMTEAAKTSVKVEDALKMTSEDVDRLVVNLMTEKVNKKYNGLHPEQKQIIQLFVFSKDNPDVQSQLSGMLSELKQRFVVTLSSHLHEFAEDKVLVKKLEEVKTELQGQFADTCMITEDMVSFYLGLSKLDHEVRMKEEGPEARR